MNPGKNGVSIQLTWDLCSQNDTVKLSKAFCQTVTFKLSKAFCRIVHFVVTSALSTGGTNGRTKGVARGGGAPPPPEIRR